MEQATIQLLYEICLILSMWFWMIILAMYIDVKISYQVKTVTERYERKQKIKKIIQEAGCYPLFMYHDDEHWYKGGHYPFS